MAITKAPGAPLSPEVQAAALWTYVKGRIPRFTSGDALEVIREVSPAPSESIKHLAKRLRPAMEKRGFKVKLAACIESSARIQGFENWHSATTPEDPHLVLVVLPGFLTQSGPATLHEETFTTWRELAPRLAHWCDQRQLQTAAKVFEIRVTPENLTITTPVPRGDRWPGQLTPETLFGVRPSSPGTQWLEGAAAAIEYLRRHLEERGVAVLDGASVLQLCEKYSLRGLAGLPSASDINMAADVPNTELVLMREDNELNPASGFEIARGDEMTCWSQFELAINDHNEGAPVLLDGEAWRVGNGRYVWDLSTIRPQEYVPGLAIRRLNEQDAERLLRRYNVARGIFGGTVTHYEVTKRVDFLGAPKETYRVNLQVLERAAAAAGRRTWEQLCEDVGSQEERSSYLSLGFIINAANAFSPGDPNTFFARPAKHEMVRLEHEEVVRTLLPRVEGARYRLGTVPDSTREAVKEAVADLNDSLRLRMLSKAGVFADAKSELPQLVYASDAEELRGKLQDLGLVAYAGVLPNLVPVEKLTGEAAREGMSPFAFGHILYLHIEQDGD